MIENSLRPLLEMQHRGEVFEVIVVDDGSTDDTAGHMRGYVGSGNFTDDPLETFGGAGVVEIPRMQKLLHYICENGFEHHVAANF